MAMVNIKIEGISYQVEEGLTILEAAKKCGYEIPYFVHLITVSATRVHVVYVSLRQQALEAL